jgi:hypothetical protein
VTTSTELRWFYKGGLPPDVKDWFCGSALCIEEEARSDHYLVFPGSAAIGVKVRDGSRLEIKARLTEPAPFSLPGGSAIGQLDSWTKWSHQDKEVADRLGGLRFGDPLWVTVLKERWLRKFQIDDVRLEEVDASAKVERGCSIEVTRLSVQDTPWWTFAFESFGSPVRPEDLQRAAAHFLKLLPHSLVLTQHDSCSYPEWLNRLTR